MFDKKVYDVYSSKHKVNGRIYDYGVLIKLMFEYENFAREIALASLFPSNSEEAFKELGEKMLDFYIDNLVLKGKKEDRCFTIGIWKSGKVERRIGWKWLPMVC